MSLRNVTFIVVHHSASPRKTTSVGDIRKWHKKKGWTDIGYHAVIHEDGGLHRGRPEHLVGAHCKGANTGSLGVCVVGNFENEEPSGQQVSKLVYLLAYWCTKYGIDPKEIYPHRNKGVTATLCPGQNLCKHLHAIRAAVKTISSNPSVILGWPS